MQTTHAPLDALSASWTSVSCDDCGHEAELQTSVESAMHLPARLQSRSSSDRRHRPDDSMLPIDTDTVLVTETWQLRVRSREREGGKSHAEAQVSRGNQFLTRHAPTTRVAGAPKGQQRGEDQPQGHLERARAALGCAGTSQGRDDVFDQTRIPLKVQAVWGPARQGAIAGERRAKRQRIPYSPRGSAERPPRGAQQAAGTHLASEVCLSSAAAHTAPF